MPAVVAGQKINLSAMHRPTDDCAGWGAKRRFDPLLGRVLDTFHLIQPASADNPDCWRILRHGERLKSKLEEWEAVYFVVRCTVLRYSNDIA